MTKTKINDAVINLVCENKPNVLGSAAIYRLLEIELYRRKIYAVTVSFLGENREVFIGESESVAERFYRLMYENAVTPTTFLDVFKDFSSEIQ